MVQDMAPGIGQRTLWFGDVQYIDFLWVDVILFLALMQWIFIEHLL